MSNKCRMRVVPGRCRLDLKHMQPRCALRCTAVLSNGMGKQQTCDTGFQALDLDTNLSRQHSATRRTSICYSGLLGPETYVFSCLLLPPSKQHHPKNNLRNEGSSVGVGQRSVPAAWRDVANLVMPLCYSRAYSAPKFRDINAVCGGTPPRHRTPPGPRMDGGSTGHDWRRSAQRGQGTRWRHSPLTPSG